MEISFLKAELHTSNKHKYEKNDFAHPIISASFCSL